ncbi:MAG: helix-turn-helix domain-containing protein [Methanothrix sp.]|nr:helix-turn-helix domain-containing protein [Methanothrix sp.]
MLTWYTLDTKVFSLERFCKDTMQEGCTVNLTVKYIARKWTLLILLELYKGEGHTRRFTELKNCLFGITQKVLSARLRELEKEGLVVNRVDSTLFPVKSEYILTESGLEIIDIVKDMKHWALKWKITNIKCECQDCQQCVL